jgi:hypothetical protein
MKLTVLTIILAVASIASAQTITHPHRIYVDPELSYSNGLLRSKLIASLAQYCKDSCTVVEAAAPNGDNGDENSDSVLTGTIIVESNYQQRYRVQGAMRLLDHDGTVIWASTVYSGHFARSATSSFADATAKQIAAYLSKRIDERT